PEVRDVCPRFLRTTELLARAAVRAPKVLAVDVDRGWMALEDLGPWTLAEWKGRPWSELQAYFEDALAAARRIAALPAESVAELSPPLDRALLERELAQTGELFLEPRDLVGTTAVAASLRSLLAELCANLAADSPVPCHRDFMARNLMPLAGPSGSSVAVLDHQDLRLGPPAYDLASLLNDSLSPPAEMEAAFLALAAPGTAGRLRYHRAAAQRTLKAVGTYASFARRGAMRHLPLIAPTLARCLDHLGQTPEGAPLRRDLARAWRPILH